MLGIENVINNMVTTNNNVNFSLEGSFENTISNMVTTHARNGGGTGQALTLNASADSDRFTSLLMFGDNDFDVIDGGSINPGIDVGLNEIGNSTALTPLTGYDLSGTFIGEVGAPGDSENASDTNGVVTAVPQMDWTHFENWYRLWGIDASVFPNEDNRDHCGTGESCRILDFSLLDGGGDIFNNTLDGVNPNGDFPTDSSDPCPSAVNGSETIDILNGSTVLRNAVEIMYDKIGNDDGLCESNEACVYTPNFGAYQGTGDYYERTCEFQDGLVTGVTIYAYPENGVTP